MATLGQLVVNLEANISRFTSDMGRASEVTEKAMERMSGAADTVKTVLGAIGVAFTVDGIVSEVNRAVDGLARLDDMAQKAGASAEVISKLGKVAAFTGTDIGAVDGAIVKLAKNMAAADEKGSKFAKAMGALGLSVEDIKSKDPAQQFVDIANALQDYEDGAGKAAIMTDLINKSAADLLPYMNDVAESINDFTGDTAEAAAAAAKYQDDLGRMKVKYDEVTTSIVQAALPAMTDFVGGLSDGVRESSALTGIAIDSWADDTAVGLARVVDVAVLLPRLLSTIGGSFKAVAADIEFLATAAATATPQAIGRSLANGVNPIDKIRTALEERNAVVDEANRKLDDLWNRPANTMEQAVLKRIDARQEAAAAAGADALAGIVPGSGGGKPEPRKTLDYGGEDGSGKASSALSAQLQAIDSAFKREQETASYHSAFMRELFNQGAVDVETYNRFRIASIEQARDSAVRAYDAEISALQAARAAAKDAAEQEALDAKIREKSAEKQQAMVVAGHEAAQVTLEQVAAQAGLSRAMADWGRRQDAALAQQKLSNDLHGKTTVEVIRLTAAKRAQLEVEEAIRRAQERGAVSPADIAKYKAEAGTKAQGFANESIRGEAQGLMNSLQTPGEAEEQEHTNRLAILQAYREQEFADTAAANLALERENQRHEQAMFEMKAATQQSVVSLMADSSGQLYDVLKQAGLEQTALGKAAFLATKAMAVAQIILNTNMAAAAAMAPPPIGLGPIAGPGLAGTIKAMGYASAAMTAGLAIAEASAEGGYDIPAGVNPVTQLHEKEMVLPKAQAEVIRGLAANGGARGGAGVTVTYSPNIQIDGKTDMAENRKMIAMAVAQGNADLVDRLQRAGRI